MSPASLGEFRKLLFKIWFELYNRSRGGRPDSSGFEHVFTGEIKVRAVNTFVSGSPTINSKATFYLSTWVELFVI